LNSGLEIVERRTAARIVHALENETGDLVSDRLQLGQEPVWSARRTSVFSWSRPDEE